MVGIGSERERLQDFHGNGRQIRHWKITAIDSESQMCKFLIPVSTEKMGYDCRIPQ